MIYIEESFPDDKSVIIRADGILDGESIPILREICERNWSSRKEVRLNLENLLHISREGRDFLKEIRNRVTLLENLPFMGIKEK